ncbi:bifunctional diaminohydroxyphosphoribosylaminopyrimidine deaminase/5-amino-6-(5-phosphoribosylamino)uracil reductase RibD [Sulfurirhabdus autotrophica]|uniref:Riboflavin biosynthesis protein RibD n=1 Tax=Sulfurirhabdus autotrophica TaxID=1706046 RepID=A0A4V2W1T7_9PROT|nr:bifunctional diaminohydroxyphosphoribosylaminopyrimidine deaminase/5-amino-6-(5-phosphoribosylamino)uracil reductase RibD [Sulfurirhabdus autotrophica]TCV85439.1 diaminohydroxyphosphoribosylaminopyrimidine deaminase [Sulfurirhabdus autotrophica]
MFSAADYDYMARALRLAEKGLFGTSPNPRVGCVIVQGGNIVGEGWHERAGTPHAEVHALRAAGNAAEGATAYVTLEPCSHHGRTPPCADALIGAKVDRVVVAMQDPNPLVAGQGLAKLQAAGIQVESGLLEMQAQELNIGFVSRMTRRRPWVRLKTASSLDGKTALNNGASFWITGDVARLDVHRLRARSCAILTGIGTVLADDPKMDVRDVETFRQPLRIVLDSSLRTPLNARILTTGKTLIVGAIADKEKIARLESAGAEVLILPDASGRVDFQHLLRELAEREVNELMIEAGCTLNGAWLNAGLVDEWVMYTAPLLLGDKARGLFALPELTEMTPRREVTIRDVTMVGRDIRIRALVSN